MYTKEQARLAGLDSAARFTGGTLLLVLSVLPVQAQTNTSTLPAVTVMGSQVGAGLTAPVSTGSGLDLTPMQTPASIDVISREQLEERGDHSVVDAITRAGGISAMGHPGNGGSSLSARGFTDTTSVMRLYDGMRQYGGVGLTFPFDTWPIERIEVLRGPASVIYGDGAIGGVVNVIPKKPTRGPVENELEATLGTDDTARLGLGSGGALSDRWSYRVDLSGARSDGWVDHGESRDATFSGALQWDATEDLSLRLSHAYGYQKPMKYFGTPLVEGGQQEALREKNYNVSDSEIRYRDQWTDLSALWTPNAATIVRARLYHIDSRRDYRNAERYIYNETSGLIDRSDNTEIHHEQKQTGLTADAAFDGRLFGLDNKVSVGFDVSASSFQHSNNTYSGTSPSVDPYDPVPGYFHSDEPTIPRYRNKADQYALFIEDRLALTPEWSVLAGLRYDHTKLNRQDLVSDSRAFERTYADFGWRMGTVYDLTPGLALYAQYSVAADPVGGMLLLSPANSLFEMSKGKQLEVGLKQSFWEGSGEWTLAAYHIKKNNLLSRDPADPALRIQVGEQSSRGVEASLAVTPARGWRVEANASILRARFDDFQEASGGAVVSRQGNVPPNVAQRLANVWVSWNFQPGWTAMAGLRYVGKRYADNANSLELPSYTTTDLALRWDVDKDTTITARGFNIFDKAYFTTAYYTPTQWLYGPGRRFELTLNHRF
ncbi:TonB-dependent receptor [Pusillimonas sp. T7-7]|uniref:TonB-dependent receptor n=1 Tax=Pusillimonas sp. (strain T7-7) TaxID=1007105 RepID=UPI0002084F30|nr:TonB-dependent receptor [Pusillimonas sp. T7-7]